MLKYPNPEIMKKYYLLIALFLSAASLTHAQDWMRDMHDPRVNFFIVQQEFNDWWAVNGQKILSDTAKEKGENEGAWVQYRRWEHQMMPLMVASGGVRLGAPDPAEKSFYQQRQALQNQRSAANWTYIGPEISFADGFAPGSDSSAGRVNCVRFDPVNPNVIYCGAPTGGLWKSSDFGSNWQLLNTDNLPQIGISDIAINPVNPGTIYIATGDIANAECTSIGVLKSADGGQTWDTTGLSFTVSQGMLIARLLMSPLDSNTLFAATNAGVYKTTDGGATWSKVNAGYGFTGMEFNPANPNTIYIWGTQLYKSVDAGNTWVQLSNGLPNAQTSGGFAIGITPADTACIYVVVSGGTPETGESYYPFNGFYRSLNAGDTFTLQSTNIDPSSSGLGNGTQGTYDLNVGVSAVNRDVLVVGAVNSEFSTDGGITWTTAGTPSHVDHHDIRFFHNSVDTVFSADDGGLFISTDTGNTWQGRNNGMHIGEIYNISSGPHTKYLYLSGRQDEGTLLQDSSSQRIVFGGDGLECIIDPLNENHMFASTENGDIGSSYNEVSVNILAYNWGTGVNGPGVWNTPYALQNNNSGNLYVGKDYIYKSEDGGGTWTTLNSPHLTGSDNLYQLLAIAPSDPNYIYAATYSSLYRSTNGGATFTNVTDGYHGYFTSLAVSPANPAEIWIGFNGTGASLLKSVDAGSHFTSFATGLPASPPFYTQSIAAVRNSMDAVYIGLAHGGGVYYRDSTLSNWVPFGNGLPNVTVDQLEVDYCAEKIRAATYGRDIWESDPYAPMNVPPTANATISGQDGNCLDTVTFTDNSNYLPTAWQWYFPGGEPSSSTAQNPVVVYRNGSNYSATFIASNANGADTVQYLIGTNTCVGIDQVADNSIISVYPNPNNGNFILSVTGQARGKVTMAVMNNIGDVVYQYAYTKDDDAKSNECSLTALARGVYYVRVTTGNTSSVQKLVIEN